LIKWIAKHYYTAIHNSFSLFVPKNLREKIIKDKVKIDKTEEFNYNFNYSNKLSLSQEKAYKEIKNSKNKKILLY
jgi:primosomal protein N'